MCLYLTLAVITEAMKLLLLFYMFCAFVQYVSKGKNICRKIYVYDEVVALNFTLDWCLSFIDTNHQSSS